MSTDLEPAELGLALPGRPLRVYPALLSTEVDAMAWARSGAPSGAVVVADYQASPRGRGGLPWTSEPGRGLGFSLVLRPDLPPEREGWPYLVVSLALTDALTGESALEWPDTVLDRDGAIRAALGMHAGLGPGRVEWVVANVLVHEAAAPRATLLARCIETIEQRLAQPAQLVVSAYRERCSTLGRSVRARLIPLGPGGPELTGEAVDILDDGALVLLTERGNRVAVRPQNLGRLEEPETEFEP